MSPRRRATDARRASPGLLITALIVVAGWSLFAAAAFGWLP
jgi:hypothetical protein